MRDRSGLSMLALLALVLGSLGAHGDVSSIVHLRDGTEKREGTIRSESVDGIEIEIEIDRRSLTQFLRWDQIRSILGDAPTEVRLARLKMGERLWRGRFRLARQDLRGARACFLAALAELSPPATLGRAMTNEGIARTAQVDEQAWTQSLEAALTDSVLRGRVAIPLNWMDGVSSFDPASGLHLAVPPVWVDQERAKQAESELRAAEKRARAASDDGLAKILGDCARIAAADAGSPAPPPLIASESKPAGEPAEPAAGQGGATTAARAAARSGAAVIAAWANALSADPALRKRGRTELRKTIANEDGLVRIWALYAEGRSSAMEDDPEEVRRGVGRMLLIPAAYATESPVLARAALVQSTRALARIQDDESAEKLRQIAQEYHRNSNGNFTTQEGDRP